MTRFPQKCDIEHMVDRADYLQVRFTSHLLQSMRVIRSLVAAAALAMLPSISHAQSVTAASVAKTDTTKVDLTGKWAFSIEQPFAGTPTVNFTQKGDSISGQYISNALGTHNFVGTAKAGVVAFS